MLLSQDDMLRAIAYNAYQHYASTIVPQTPAQEETQKFMKILKPGCWVLETSNQRLWQTEITKSIGRLVWAGQLPIHAEDWSEGKRPLDDYFIVQGNDESFTWWYNCSFIRIFSSNDKDRWLINHLLSAKARQETEELDASNMNWAKGIALQYGLNGLLNESFEDIIVDYAQRYYDRQVDKSWHPWQILSLFPPVSSS